MSCDFNSIKPIGVPEGVDVVSELVDKTDMLRYKFKGNYFKYNLGKDRYDLLENVYFFASLPNKTDNIQIGSIITLNLPITKVYIPLIPDTHDPERDKLLKIIVNCACEYMRDGNNIYESQYEIVLA